MTGIGDYGNSTLYYLVGTEVFRYKCCYGPWPNLIEWSGSEACDLVIMRLDTRPWPTLLNCLEHLLVARNGLWLLSANTGLYYHYIVTRTSFAQFKLYVSVVGDQESLQLKLPSNSTNVFGASNVTRAFFPYMRAKKTGTVIFHWFPLGMGVCTFLYMITIAKSFVGPPLMRASMPLLPSGLFEVSYDTP